jgi:hypothetical protein
MLQAYTNMLGPAHGALHVWYLPMWQAAQRGTIYGIMVLHQVNSLSETINSEVMENASSGSCIIHYFSPEITE